MTDLVTLAQVFEFRSVLTGHGPPPAVRSFRGCLPSSGVVPAERDRECHACRQVRVHEQHVGFLPGCPPLPLGWGMDWVVLARKL